MKIKKAKLAKSGCLEAVYIDTDGNEVSIKGYNKCHNDLRQAFDRLVPFFADLTEQREADKINWDDIECEENSEALKNLSVSGLSIGGDPNNEIITMTGKRTLLTRRVLNLNAPGVEMNSETFEWPYVSEFDVAVQGVLYEVEQYLFHKKWQVVQLELNFDGNPDDPFAEPQPTEEAVPVEDVA